MRITQPSPNLQPGVTLLEMLTVVIILGILAGMALPKVVGTVRETKARDCGAQLRLIESAKSKWRHEFPQAELRSIDDLKRYFPANQYPKDPWGVGFVDDLDISKVTTHSYNGDESKGDHRGDDVMANGYNDVAQP